MMMKNEKKKKKKEEKKKVEIKGNGCKSNVIFFSVLLIWLVKDRLGYIRVGNSRQVIKKKAMTQKI